MEPQFFNRGNRAQVPSVAEIINASMEPQFFNRGNQLHLVRIRVIPLKLQWSHNFSIVETLYKKSSLMKVFRLQWSHNFSIVETTRHLDPALAVPHLLQWSHNFSIVETRRFVAEYSRFKSASMEPQFFNRGNLSATFLSKSVKSCFNGATIFQSWKQ